MGIYFSCMIERVITSQSAQNIGLTLVIKKGFKMIITRWRCWSHQLKNPTNQLKVISIDKIIESLK